MKRFFMMALAAAVACGAVNAQTDASKRPVKKTPSVTKVDTPKSKYKKQRRNYSRPHQVSQNQKIEPTATQQPESKQPVEVKLTKVSVEPIVEKVVVADVPNVQTFYANGVSFEMVEVLGGTFTMGATSEQTNDADSEEKPAHRVTLNDFSIGKTEVTQALWKAVMGNNSGFKAMLLGDGNPSHFKGDNLPVENVSWNDCKKFLKKLNKLTGKNFRLPTEAEWEYACRGGNSSRGYKYSGSDALNEVGWFYDNSGNCTHPVGEKAPNELGIHDMSGNVCEWCSDWKGGYGSNEQWNPAGPLKGSTRVYRGGCWSNEAKKCRSSSRGNEGSVSHSDDSSDDSDNEKSSPQRDFRGIRLAL